MHRVLELVSRVRSAYPSDDFFLGFERSLRDATKRRYYAAYERAFLALNVPSWNNLLRKAVAHFPETRYR